MASALPQRVPGASASRPRPSAGGEQAGRRSSRAVGQPEPGGDAEHQPDRQPERQLGALGLEQALRAAHPGGAEDRRQRSACRQWRRFAYARGARVTGRHAPILGETARERKRKSSPASRPRRPDSSISAAPAPPCSTGSIARHHGGQLPAADRGHRQGALDPAGDRRDPRRHDLARPRLGRRRPISSRNSPSATPRSRTSCSRRGHAYRCWMTPEELAAQREAAQAERRPFRIEQPLARLRRTTAPATRPSSSASRRRARARR